MDTMNNMHTLIKDARERRGYRTQGELADRIGRDVSWVSRLERGYLKEIPQPEMMEALADALGLTVAQMLDAAGYDVLPRADDPADVLTIRRDDPRADLLALLDGETDDAVRNVAVLVGAAKRLSAPSINPKRDIPSPKDDGITKRSASSA